MCLNLSEPITARAVSNCTLLAEAAALKALPTFHVGFNVSVCWTRADGGRCCIVSAATSQGRTQGFGETCGGELDSSISASTERHGCAILLQKT
jgi:hypothetical protein